LNGDNGVPGGASETSLCRAVLAQKRKNMLGFFKPKKADAFLLHWCSLIPDFSISTEEFYSLIQAELTIRKVPGLTVSRVRFAEGGLLSVEREYLRMTRELLVFDVCAAPFGTSYFFSCRLAELPPVVEWWQLFIFFFMCFVLFLMAMSVVNVWNMLIVVPFFAVLGLGGAVALVYVLRNAVSLGLKDLDAQLVRIPVLGPLYVRFLRRETYYRQDTRLMYCTFVDALVKKAVEEVAGKKGITLVRYNEYSPLIEELYRPRLVTVESPPVAKPPPIESPPVAKPPSI
jgi:hypothetical protein